MQNFFKSAFSESSAKAARTTALHSLQWMVFILLSGLSSSVLLGAEGWVKIAIGVGIGAVLLVYLASHLYLLLKNPDALRSEQYSLQKLAMEKGLMGDSLRGVVDMESELGKLPPKRRGKAGAQSALPKPEQTGDEA
jgi:hypothetical protein